MRPAEPARRRSPRLAAALALLAMVATSIAPRSAAQELATPGPDEPRPRRWHLFGDLAARGDDVERPAADDLERLRLRVRPGLRLAPSATLELRAALWVAAASYEPLADHDNQERSGAGLDRLALRWQPLRGGELTAGKDQLALRLSPMLWDEDLRPLSLSWSQRLPVRTYDAVVLAGGVFESDDRFTDGVRLGAAQAGWLLREGALAGGEAWLTALAIDRLDQIRTSGEAPGEPQAAALPVDDYEILDLQLGGWRPVGRRAVAGRLEAAENLAADEAATALRASASWRSAAEGGRLEAGLTAQRVGAAALLAGLASDDWWFRAGSRGFSLWASLRLPRGWRLRLAGFRERADGAAEETRRLLADIGWRW